jgi:hypothetical protein
MGPPDSGRHALLGALSDHRVAQGEPDPRGWTVMMADGREAAIVDDPIIDSELLKVRYLVCRSVDAGRAVLMPIGYARLDVELCRVLFDTLDSTALARLPPYTGLPVSASLENALHEAFTGRAEPESESG